MYNRFVYTFLLALFTVAVSHGTPEHPAHQADHIQQQKTKNNTENANQTDSNRAQTKATTAANSKKSTEAKKQPPQAEEVIISMSVLGRGADGGSLGGQDLKVLPLASMVVNRQEIQRIKFVDPDEFLDRIPGESQTRNLRIPQGCKSYTIPLVDGQPLGSPYRGATQDITDVNSFDIERIEITKGPATALYPSNAFGGTINVITRTPPAQPEYRVWSEGGDFHRRRLGAQAAGSIRDLGFFLDANLQQTDGFRDTYTNDRSQLSGKLVYTPNEKTTLSLRGERIHRDEVFPGDLSQTEFDQNPSQIGRRRGSQEDIDSFLTSFKFVKQFGNTSELELGYVHRSEDSVGIGRFSGPNETELADSSLKIMVSHQINWWDSRFVVGADRFDGRTDFAGFDDENRTEQSLNASSKSKIGITAIFGQWSFKPLPQVTLTTGIRREEIDMDSSDRLEERDVEKTFSSSDPKFGVVYQVQPRFSAWFGYSKGFLTPDIEDLFISRNANPDLLPEQARNLEIGIRLNQGKLRIESSVYDLDISDFLVAEEIVNDQGIALLQLTNAGKVNLRGVESVVEYVFNHRFSFGLTHTYARNVYQTFFHPRSGQDLSGNRLSRSPEHHINLRSSFLPSERWSTELEIDGYSGYYTHDDNAIDSRGKFKREPRVNLRLGYRYGSWDLWLHGLNLTDTLEDRVGFSRGQRTLRLIDGRNLYAGLGYRF